MEVLSRFLISMGKNKEQAAGNSCLEFLIGNGLGFFMFEKVRVQKVFGWTGVLGEV